MSGGSMDYLYFKVENADFILNTPERRAFKDHLFHVAQALREIEWVDSGDSGAENESVLIRACLTPGDVLQKIIFDGEILLDKLRVELAKVKANSATET